MRSQTLTEQRTLFCADSQHALELLERIQERIKGGEDLAPDEDLSNLIYLLDSPLFMQLINVQDSVMQLKQVRGTTACFSFQGVTEMLPDYHDPRTECCHAERALNVYFAVYR